MNQGANTGMGMNTMGMGMGNFNMNQHNNNNNQILASLLGQMSGASTSYCNSDMNQGQNIGYGNYGNSIYGNQNQSTNQQQGFTGMNNNNLATLSLLNILGQNGLGNMMGPLGMNMNQPQTTYPNQ